MDSLLLDPRIDHGGDLTTRVSCRAGPRSPRWPAAGAARGCGRGRAASRGRAPARARAGGRRRRASSRTTSTSVTASSVAERGQPSKNASSPSTDGASIVLNAPSSRGSRTPTVPSVSRYSARSCSPAWTSARPAPTCRTSAWEKTVAQSAAVASGMNSRSAESSWASSAKTMNGPACTAQTYKVRRRTSANAAASASTWRALLLRSRSTNGVDRRRPAATCPRPAPSTRNVPIDCGIFDVEDLLARCSSGRISARRAWTSSDGVPGGQEAHRRGRVGVREREAGQVESSCRPRPRSVSSAAPAPARRPWCSCPAQLAMSALRRRARSPVR